MVQEIFIVLLFLLINWNISIYAFFPKPSELFYIGKTKTYNSINENAPFYYTQFKKLSLDFYYPENQPLYNSAVLSSIYQQTASSTIIDQLTRYKINLKRANYLNTQISKNKLHLIFINFLIKTFSLKG